MGLLTRIEYPELETESEQIEKMVAEDPRVGDPEDRLDEESNANCFDNTESDTVGGEKTRQRIEHETAPIFSTNVRRFLRGNNKSTYTQYALLGRELPSSNRPNELNNQLFLNTNAPWSTFICGSQGSGKSYTLSCILENCLLKPGKQKYERILRRNPKPAAGIVFHFDPHGSTGAVSEAAYLASHMKIRILVPATSYAKRMQHYTSLPGISENNIEVQRLYLNERHLNVDRIKNLMAFGEGEGGFPLYWHVIVQILQDWSMKNQGSDKPVDWNEFLSKIEEKRSTMQVGQINPLQLRLQLMERILDPDSRSKGCKGHQHGNVRHPQKKNKEKGTSKDVTSKDDTSKDIFKAEPGCLTIVDLTDTFIDVSSACILFKICLDLFLESSGEVTVNGTKVLNASVGKLIVLDEAHKFLDNSIPSRAVEAFAQTLIQTVREQRHKGARIVISTQEPSISPKLLDLCNFTVVHRFTSPEWFRVLKTHLAGASEEALGEATATKFSSLLRAITDLSVGESLVFCPSGILDVLETQTKEGEVISKTTRKLGLQHFRMQTRKRITNDGGMSIMAN